jgi:hypothetical protein
VAWPRWAFALLVFIAGCGTTAEPSTAGSEPPAAPASIEPGRYGWAHIDLEFADPGQLSGITVRGGTLDGETTFDVDHRFPPLVGEKGPGLLRASPFLSDVRRMHVLYGYFDGRVSELNLVDLETGAKTLVHTTREVIHSAALADDGTIFFLVLDAATREEQGIFRIQPGQPRTPFMPARGLRPQPFGGSTLYVTPGGEALLIHDCGVDACVLRVHAVSDGRLIREVRTINRRLLGVFDEVAVVMGDCLAPCPALAVPLQGDGTRPVGIACDGSRSVLLGREIAVVSSGARDCQGDARDLVVSPFGGASATIGRAELAGMELVGPSPLTAVELPSGWIVVAADGILLRGSAGSLLDVSTGASYAFELE